MNIVVNIISMEEIVFQHGFKNEYRMRLKHKNNYVRIKRLVILLVVFLGLIVVSADDVTHYIKHYKSLISK